MRDLLELLVTFCTIIFALVVAWILANESFPYVAILLAIYSCWVVFRWLSRKRTRETTQKVPEPRLTRDHQHYVI